MESAQVTREKMCTVIGIQAMELTTVYRVLLWGFSSNTFCRKHSAPSKKIMKYRSSFSFSKSINGVFVCCMFLCVSHCLFYLAFFVLVSLLSIVLIPIV
jgi:hypothetical protein